MKIHWAIFLLAWPVLAADEVVQSVIAQALKPVDEMSAISFDAAAYEGDLKSLPIGVFDSGIGGLTVLEALLTLDVFHNGTLQPGADGVADFAQERFIYFGDQANMPYGNYSSVGKTDYLRELILKDALFLLGKRWFDAEKQTFRMDKPPVKAIVIACNTATAYGIEDVRAALSAWGLPVIVVGVVEAGARGVQEAHQGGAVGVLATVGTCASGAYPRVIGRILGLAGRNLPVITQHGSAALAGVIEGDPAYHQTVAECVTTEVRSLIDEHRGSLPAAPLSTLVLGCTHYPLAQQEITQALTALRQRAEYRDSIAETVALVNPAEWTARELFRSLATARLRAPEATRAAKDQFFYSIPNPLRKDLPLSAEGGLEKEFKYQREPGNFSHEDTVNIPLNSANLPAVSRKLVEERLPAVWSRLREP